MVHDDRRPDDGRSGWSVARIVLIWCAWPVVVVLLVLLMSMLRGGGSIDLLHGPGRWAELAVMLAPPIVATLVWGRR